MAGTTRASLDTGSPHQRRTKRTGDFAGLPSGPVDEAHVAICELVVGDPSHAADRERIVEAMLTDAREHDGIIDPDRVRARLSSDAGLQVYPRVLSAMYGHLTRAGVLQFEGEWTRSQDSRGGNAGKPARIYRLRVP